MECGGHRSANRAASAGAVVSVYTVLMLLLILGLLVSIILVVVTGNGWLLASVAVAVTLLVVLGASDLLPGHPPVDVVGTLTRAECEDRLVAVLHAADQCTTKLWPLAKRVEETQAQLRRAERAAEQHAADRSKYLQQVVDAEPGQVRAASEQFTSHDRARDSYRARM